jgi:hypothetical protein
MNRSKWNIVVAQDWMKERVRKEMVDRARFDLFKSKQLTSLSLWSWDDIEDIHPSTKYETRLDS